MDSDVKHLSYIHGKLVQGYACFYAACDCTWTSHNYMDKTEAMMARERHLQDAHMRERVEHAKRVLA